MKAVLRSLVIQGSSVSVICAAVAIFLCFIIATSVPRGQRERQACSIWPLPVLEQSRLIQLCVAVLSCGHIGKASLGAPHLAAAAMRARVACPEVKNSWRET